MTRFRVALVGTVAAVVAATTVASASAATEQGTDPDDTRSLLVETEGGWLEGVRRDPVDAFLGVPYAAPPVGELRWQPPAAALARWSGVRHASQAGPNCPQLSSSIANEDCLYLNVHRPASASKRPLPVMFYIHGGGFSGGSGSQFDGALLAETNDMIVITFNYRLGVFGFLNLPGLSEQGSGNYGLLDQVSALEWANDNIAAFGGDPSQITIAGRSAGGHSVCALLASPLTEGLFQAAVIQSGGCPSHSVAESTADGEAFADEAGCTDEATRVACLRAQDGDALLGASRGFVGGILTGPLPTAGVPELPLPPYDAVRSGEFNNVPMMIGSTRDEVRRWAAPFANATPEQYEAALRETYGEHAPDVLARYPMDPGDGPYAAAYALGAAWTDSSVFYGLGGCEYADLAQIFASHQPRTFVYRFDDRTAPAPPPLPNYHSGAFHGADRPYIWPSPTGPVLDAQQQQLSHEIVRYLGDFVTTVRTGSVNVQGQASWPSFRSGQVMSLRQGGSGTISQRAFDADHHCSFWRSIDYPWLTQNPSDLARQVGVESS